MARIREVWAANLDAEMRNIRECIDKYPYVAMDTEFPGVVARPIGSFKASSDYHYQTMRCNVDLLKIIQIGITLADEEGHYPEEVCTWQFNFHFSIGDDMYSPESIDLLHKSGIDFPRHETEGIKPSAFAELLITSGLVLFDEVKWISFHSGYDFGYLVKLLTAENLPAKEEEFFELFSIWFPIVYDVKFMMRACKGLKGGLQDVADDLGVMRIGPSHQAGSDSLLTAATFFKMREIYFNDRIDDGEYNGKLYGLGQTATLALTNGVNENGISTPGSGAGGVGNGNGSLSVSSTMSGLGSAANSFAGAGGAFGGFGIGGAAMTAYGLRSGATIAERERTPLPNSSGAGGAAGQSGVQGSQGSGPGTGPLPTPGLSGFSLGSTYGSVPNGPYMRQINVGGER